MQAVQREPSIRVAYWAYLTAFAIVTLSAALQRPFPGNFDELMHASYVVHLAKTGRLALESIGIPIYDPNGWTLTGEFDYTPHQSGYYAFLAVIARALLPLDASGVIVLRLVNTCLTVAGVAVSLRLGLLAGWGRPAWHAFALIIILIPNLVLIAGAISNDNLAILGGCVAALGAYRALAGGRQSTAVLVMAVGFALAALAKAIAALQVGIMLAAVFAVVLARGGTGLLREPKVIVAGLIGFAAALPYLTMTMTYGSPVPLVPGLEDQLATHAAALGWTSVSLDLVGYAMFFVKLLAAHWSMQAQFGHPIVLPGIGVALVGGVGLALAGYDVMRGAPSPMAVLVLCGAVALALTMALHFAFSYELYRRFGHFGTVHPRYYFPLLFVIPAACAHVIGTVPSGWARLTVAGIVILLAFAPNLLQLARGLT